MNKDQIFKEIASAIYNNPHTEAIEFAEYANYLVLFATEGLIEGVEYPDGIALELTDKGVEKLFESVIEDVMLRYDLGYSHWDAAGKWLYVDSNVYYSDGDEVQVQIQFKNLGDINHEFIQAEVEESVERYLSLFDKELKGAEEERKWEMAQSVGYTCGIVG